MAFFSNIFGSTSSADGAVPNAPAPAPAVTPAVQATPAVEVSPLDSFKTLWEPVNTPNVDGTLPANMFAGADPAKMLDAARKVDFAKSISPELLAKITSGGPDAATAFMAALNDVSQRSYAQSSFASTKIVEAALAKIQEGLDSRLPGQIKRHQVSDTLRESNPALQHPAAAPILDALQSQLAVKFPNATVNELRDMAGDYLNKFAGLASPQKTAATKPTEDWDKFFG